MILSLPNLGYLELMGEYSNGDKGPPEATVLRQPIAKNIQNARLRGYIPAAFVAAICEVSDTSIQTLDLGLLDAQ